MSFHSQTLTVTLGRGVGDALEGMAVPSAVGPKVTKLTKLTRPRFHDFEGNNAA
jgi:hypothetical protein